MKRPERGTPYPLFTQKTIARPVAISGVGIHTGRPVRVRLNPAPEGTGILFRRADSGGVEIPALASEVSSVELATTLGFEARAYDAVALANACPPGSPPDPTCFASTDLARRDRFARASVELSWVGRQIVALGYQLVVIDSNSFGESFARHRVTVSATTGLPGGLYGTLLGILEIDQYLDGLVVQTDLVRADFANIEDENRSSLQARLAKKLSATWSLEGRAAVWRNIAASSMDLAFHRELVYLGLVYAR